MKLSKSKLALAKVINENGGWLIGGDFNFVTSSRSGAVKFFHQRPRRDGANWAGGSRRLYWVDSDEKLPKWHKTVLSREEYYHAYPKADADGWIEWSGVAKSPVGKGVAVDVKMKNGTQHFGQLIDDECWGDHWGDASIIAYRPHKPGVKPEFCESVMHGIPEPESHEKLSPEAIEDAKFALMSESIEESKRKPTIEQLAQDYRNAKDYADRLQKEAGEASVKAESFAVEIRKKILELQELIGISKPESEPELVIADWRDLRVGDEVECVESNILREKYNGMVGGLHSIDESYTSAPYLVDFGGAEKIWCHEVKFIRRP